MKMITARSFAGVLAAAICLGWSAQARAFGGNASEELGVKDNPVQVPEDVKVQAVESKTGLEPESKQAACARVMEALPAVIIVEEVKLSGRERGLLQSDCETEMAGGPAYQKDELIQAINTAVKLMKPYCEAGDTQTALMILGNIKGTQRYKCVPWGWHGYGVSRINTGLDILAKTLETHKKNVYDRLKDFKNWLLGSPATKSEGDGY